ncbi:MAG: GNAT family N-acetyltransferase [Bacteriovoracaceae bacterium]|nr:GNAT family N-acetyltransferase [Bacteriovoracaceae bacterium]
MSLPVVSYTKDDLSNISTFFRKQYTGVGTYGTMDLFQWKIIDNYLFPGIINLAKDGETIAATTSITPKEILYKGRNILAAEIGDSYTDANYQRRGLFTLLGNKTRQDGTDKNVKFIYGTPNHLALPGWVKKANFKIMTKIEVRALSMPINLGAVIQRKAHWMFRDLFGGMTSFVLFFLHKLKRITMSVPAKPSVTRCDNELPEGWDIFWQKAISDYDFIVARHKKVLEWRFFKNPNSYQFITLRDNDQIIGYLVYLIIPSTEVNRLIIADFLCLPNKEKNLIHALDFVLSEAFTNGVSTLSTWCSRTGPYYNIFKQFGFFDRGDIPIMSFQDELACEVQESGKWHFTISDSDNV